MTKTLVKKIRAAGLSSLIGDGLISVAHAVLTGLTGNAAYPAPPIDLSVLKAGIDSYTAALAAALDGGKTALHARNVQREDLIATLRALSHYVELNCKNDLTAFMSSGFPAASTARPAQLPLPPASISRIDSGATSGQMQVVVKPLPKAASYDLRYATAQPGASLGPWTTISFVAAQKAPPVTGLTPGTTYTFQVRALGTVGYTDWSDPVTRVCT